MSLFTPSLDQIFARLNSGFKWPTSTITFAFTTSASQIFTRGEAPGYSSLILSAKQSAILALSLWDDLIVPNFIEVTPNTYLTSNIEFGMSTEMGGGFAYVYTGTGSVWFNSSYGPSSGNNNLLSPAVGKHGFATYVHEIGHALGLAHAGDYNGTGNWSPSNFHDSTVFTIMSYFGPDWRRGQGDVAWADWIGADGILYSPQTPMLNDIYVIQQMYGASTTTRTDNTVYGFNSNITGTSGQIFDFARNLNPILTIYDSAGVDTLDLSGWSTPSIIDIRPGAFSSANSMTNNIAIARNTNIENARGGSGADKIYGNSLGNILWGGGGDDEIRGLGGADVIYGDSGNDRIFWEAGDAAVYGGSGSDTVFLTGNRSLYVISFYGASLAVQSAAGTLTLWEVEFLSFSDGIVTSSSFVLQSDTTAPTVTSFSPADATTGVAVGNNIVLTFSEAIARGTGTITIRSGSASGTIVESFDAATSNRISISGSTLTIDPTNNLAGNTRYFVLFSSGNIRDLAGNAYRGTSTYDFTTVGSATDTTAPTVTSFSPTDAATGVAVGNNIVLTFSEAIARGTGTITIRSGSATGTIVESFDAATSSRISISGSTLTIDPTNNLAGNTRYFVVFSSGNVRDLAGNTYAGTVTYDFTTASTATTDDYPNTADTTGVVIIGGAATTGAIETAGDLDLFRVSLTAGVTYTFNLSATSGSLDPVLVLRNSTLEQLAENDDYGSSLNSQITFTATSTGTYYLQAGGFTSSTGTYTIGAIKPDTIAPTVLSLSPADGTTGVDISGNVVATFSEDIARGSGTITIRSGSATGTIVESFDAATSNRILIIGSTLTIDPTNNLANNTRYFVVFSSGNVRDLAGNAYAGTSTYDFTTASATATDDFPNTAATTGVILVGGAARTGNIETAGDLDLFRVSLTAGATYTFNLSATSGSLDPVLVLRNSALEQIAYNDDYGSSLNSQITFTATSSGTYYLQAGDFANNTGTYQLGASYGAALTDDHPNSTATRGVVTIGGAATTGSIETTGDVDAFRVSLTAGVTYTFNLNTTSGSLDPYLSLYDSNLTRLAYNDDFGASLNSQITFTATSSGTYYLAVEDYDDTSTGTYSIRGTAQAADTIAPTVSTFSPADGTTGVAVGNNIVLTFSEAIARGTGTITVRSGSASGAIVESFDAATSNRISISGSTLTIDPTNNLAGNTRYFVVFSSGNIRDLAGNAYRGTFTYDFTTGSATTTDDFPNSTATTGVVTIGGAATTGSIETAGDLDLFRVSLTAGVTYTFNLNATSGSLDPMLELWQLNNSSWERLAYNDDFGSSLNAQITFTASSSGTYYLRSLDSFGTNTGTYSIRGTAQAADTIAPTVSTFSPADGTTGVAVGNNIVFNFSEVIARGTGTITIRSGSATGTIVESFDAATSNRISISGSTLAIDPTNDLAGNTRYFVVFSSGNVRDLAGNAYAGTSTYDFTTASATTTDDYPNSTATTGVVTIGGAATTGSIETAGDLDLFRVSLTAGVTYTFNLNATSGSLDPMLELWQLNNASWERLAYNNDYGSSLNAQITFTASSSGTYYLRSLDSFGTNTGMYSLRATTTDDYPNSTGTTGVVAIGGAATTGVIETAGDLDLFRVSLTAGVTYTFNLNATSGSLDPLLQLWQLNNSSWERLAYNDDYGSSLNSQITFTATSSGTYYLQALDVGTSTGTYSLRATISATGMSALNALSVTPADRANMVVPTNAGMPVIDAMLHTELVQHSESPSSLSPQSLNSEFAASSDGRNISVDRIVTLNSSGISDSMAPANDPAMIPSSNTEGSNNIIDITEAQILLALATRNDLFINAKLALHNFSFSEGDQLNYTLLDHALDIKNPNTADAFHFGTADVFEHFLKNELALTRTEFNAVIFDSNHDWAAHTAFYPALSMRDDVVFDATHFGVSSVVNGYHQVDFIL
jgi:methionine-rich copper-binding protein CopC